MRHKPVRSSGRLWRARRAWVLIAVLAIALVAVACEMPGAAPPTPTEAPAAEPTATPVPEEEPTATPVPEEEPTATPVPEEEPTATPAPEEEALQGDPAMGAYLFQVARGCGCHFNRDEQAYAGGNRFQVPGGVVYSANITPHAATGIGSLRESQIARLLQTGAGPGYQLHPLMPYRSYAALSNEDAHHLAAFLLSMEPVENRVPPRELASEPAPFTPDPAPPVRSPTDPVARGRMLVSLARCGQCHTPTNEDGTPNMALYLAGNRINEDEVAWNITPHPTAGIGSWSEEEIATFLRTGRLSDGSQVAGTMGLEIERSFSVLTEEDALAIAAYLKSIPPSAHEPD